jgi:TolA-binding protein
VTKVRGRKHSASVALPAAPAALLMMWLAWSQVGWASATPADDDLARRTFANAEQLMREGKAEQALRDFEQISNAYPDSGVADDALFRIGSYYYPAETVDALGTAGAKAIAAAKETFTRISAKYPREDTAPKALVKLGLIALDPVNPQRNLDEAYASFYSVVNIYPESDLLDRAFFGAGYSDFIAGKYDKSISSFERVTEEYPRSPVSEDSHYYLGLAYTRAGAFIRALEEFEAVRTDHPSGRLAARALDRLTQIYKMKVQAQSGVTPLFALDDSYKPALDPEMLRGPVALAVDSGSMVHLLNTRTATVLRLDHDGALKSTSSPLAGATSVSVDDAGLELLSAGGRVRAGVDVFVPSRLDGAAIRPVEKIAAAVRTGPGRIALLDEDHNEVLFYGDDPVKPHLMYRDPGGKARLMGLAAGGEGKLYTLDRRERRIFEISPQGTFREIAFPKEAAEALADPVALAADDIGNLFILDRRTDTIVVMTQEGKLLELIASRPGGAGEFSYASALAVGPRAEIYVYDEKRKTILRFF